MIFSIEDKQSGDIVCGYIVHDGKAARQVLNFVMLVFIIILSKLKICQRFHMPNMMQLVVKKFEKLYHLYQIQYLFARYIIGYGGSPEGNFIAACPLRLFML